MSNIVFANLAVGSVFKYNGEEYKKTQKQKVSCCKFFNATSTSDPNKKLGIKDNESVEIEVSE